MLDKLNSITIIVRHFRTENFLVWKAWTNFWRILCFSEHLRMETELPRQEFKIWKHKLYQIWCFYIKWYPTGSPKKHDNWKTTWRLLTEILERMTGSSIKPTMWKLMWYLKPSLFMRAHILSTEIDMSHVFWDSQYNPIAKKRNTTSLPSAHNPTPGSEFNRESAGANSTERAHAQIDLEL